MVPRLPAILLTMVLYSSALTAQTPTPQPAAPPPPSPSPPPQSAVLPPGWPKTIATDTGFVDLGKAISNEPGFPQKGTETDKANYIMARLPVIAKTYGLSAGSGGIASQVVVGTSRAWNWVASKVGGSVDPENADSLKGITGIGNCGEWSWMFSEILAGAGVANKVVFADTNPSPGASATHSGTDTAVMVLENVAGGRTIRRIYDPYQAAYYDKDTGQPTQESAALWANLPLSPSDMTEKDKAKAPPIWLKEVKKPFVKDGRTETVIEEPGADSANKAYLKGLVVQAKDNSPAGGVGVIITGGENFSKTLTSQGNGAFTTSLEPGGYTVAVAGPGTGDSIGISMKADTITTVTLSYQPEDEGKKPGGYFGNWLGTARITKSSDSTLVGRSVPCDMQIIDTGKGIELKSGSGLFNGLPSYQTKGDGTNLNVTYAGPTTQKNPQTTITIDFALNLTAGGDKLTGTVSSATKSVYTGPAGTGEGAISVEMALNLNRKDEDKK